MQSADYVPGKSGWKMEKGLIEMNGGPHGPIRIGDLEAREGAPRDEQMAACCSTKLDLSEPFIVVDGVTYINQALVDDFSIKARITEEASARASADEALAGRTGALEAAIADWAPRCLPGRFAVTMARNSAGHYVATGIGLGIDPGRDDKQVSLNDALMLLCSKISETDCRPRSMRSSPCAR